MKKIYEKPMLVKRATLSAVTAGADSLPPPVTCV